MTTDAVQRLRVLQLGAGVQSTSLYLMAMDGELQFDVAIFADTGDEPREVYDHLAYLETLGGPEIVRVSVGSRLGDDLVTGMNSTGPEAWARAVEIDRAIRLETAFRAGPCSSRARGSASGAFTALKAGGTGGSSRRASMANGLERGVTECPLQPPVLRL